MFRKIIFILMLIFAGQTLASECVSNVDADFSSDGLSVTAISDKGLSNVVLQFADGSEQKFEIGADGEYSLDFSGTGSNTGKTITGVWIKSGCIQSGDGSGYGDFIPACDPGLVVNLSSDQFISEPLSRYGFMTFSVSLNKQIQFTSCIATVRLSTQDGASGFQAASAGSDYVSLSDVLTFDATSPAVQNVQIEILPTGGNEPVEAFTLKLSDANNTTINDSEAVGVIEPIEF